MNCKIFLSDSCRFFNTFVWKSLTVKAKKRCEILLVLGFLFEWSLTTFHGFAFRISWRFCRLAIYHKRGKNELWLKFPLSQLLVKICAENSPSPSYKYKKSTRKLFLQQMLSWASFIVWCNFPTHRECFMVFAEVGVPIHPPS